MQNVLSVHQVSKTYGDRILFENATFGIGEGQKMALIGLNGSGKSTMMRSFYADHDIDSGSVEICGFQLPGLLPKDIPQLRRKIGIVFQDFQLLTDRNVHENLKFVLKATGWKNDKEIEDKIDEVLGKVGLKTKGFKYPFELSGGEQQRIDIARALLNSPKLILADEPTGNLDPETTDEIMNLLFQISKDLGTAIVMATHDYMVINKYPARMIRTEGGKVIDNATIAI